MPPKLSTKVSKIPSDCPLAAIDSQTKLNQKHSSRVGVPGRLQDCKIARDSFPILPGAPPEDCKIARLPGDSFPILAGAPRKIAILQDSQRTLFSFLGSSRAGWRREATPGRMGKGSRGNLAILQSSGRHHGVSDKSPSSTLISCNIPAAARKTGKRVPGKSCNLAIFRAAPGNARARARAVAKRRLVGKDARL